MPYSSTAELPDAAKKYSEQCQRAFMHAFNASHAEHGESKAFAIAHAAAQRCQEAHKSMPVPNAVEEAANPKSAQFKIFSGALTPFDGGDGRKRLRTIASSSVEDLGGDVVTANALQRMADSAKGMTIFRNHSYKVPQDILGTTEKAEVKHAGTDGNGKPIYDLVLDVVVMDSPENLQTYEAVNSGVQLGTSIGAMIPQGAATKGDNGGYIFDDLRLLEASIVGIPQNPRSWVQYAASAIKLTDDDDEDTNEAFHADAEPEVQNAKVWVTVDTEEAAPEAGDTDKDADPELAKDACPDCGGAAGHPKGDCGNAMHKAASPDLVKQDEPEDEAAIQASETLSHTGGTGEESPASESESDEDEDEDEESPAQELGESAPESADTDAEEESDDDSKMAEVALHDTVVRSADVLADLVKTMTRERVVLNKQIEDLTAERDEAREQIKAANANLEVAKQIVQRIANSPLGRKAVYREAVDDFTVRLSSMYSPEILKMLEKKDHAD